MSAVGQHLLGTVHSRSPLVIESRLESIHGLLTPADQHFVRWHGPTPNIDIRAHFLEVGDRLRLSVDELRALGAHTVIAVAECAGNGRAMHDWGQPIGGIQWGFGGVSCSAWTGVSVRTLFAKAALKPEAVEVLFSGADGVERSLPVDVAMRPDTIVAYEQNRLPVRPENGAPLRLVVPGWASIAWIKALSRITPLDHPHIGPYNSVEYVLRGAAYPGSPPVTTQSVKAVIASPAQGVAVGPGEVEISGFAWSGAGRITAVDLSIEGGPWFSARLVGRQPQHGWARWRTAWSATRGTHVLRARATDASGTTQPEPAAFPHNELGYCFNGITAHTVEVSA